MVMCLSKQSLTNLILKNQTVQQAIIKKSQRFNSLIQQYKQEDIIGDSQDSDLLSKINFDKIYKIDPFQSQRKEDQSYQDEN
ncbi:unnamed protein product (macronuclear) [Paramecium tetraurelia]|uniref:Uncharacterized protein n=1 Tax=Paramecium tetraurelia TaxID=5888 RepID=A0C2P3_PARTE|nr:uncharacterized protein GSPATT00034538001 [Paramecium tetraurelia]CAK65060.1 unnamed protein product [Paramecium tetraurelia]|eukprot:XP_001432457.1 hypothetical protein (macronuclear) [Paramecium tetraurelia strain d4-2]